MGALVAKSKLANTGLYKADADGCRPGAWIIVNKKIYKKSGDGHAKGAPWVPNGLGPKIIIQTRNGECEK